MQATNATAARIEQEVRARMAMKTGASDMRAFVLGVQSSLARAGVEGLDASEIAAVALTQAEGFNALDRGALLAIVVGETGAQASAAVAHGPVAGLIAGAGSAFQLRLRTKTELRLDPSPRTLAATGSAPLEAAAALQDRLLRVAAGGVRPPAQSGIKDITLLKVAGADVRRFAIEQVDGVVDHVELKFLPRSVAVALYAGDANGDRALQAWRQLDTHLGGGAVQSASAIALEQTRAAPHGGGLLRLAGNVLALRDKERGDLQLFGAIPFQRKTDPDARALLEGIANKMGPAPWTVSDAGEGEFFVSVDAKNALCVQTGQGASGLTATCAFGKISDEQAKLFAAELSAAWPVVDANVLAKPSISLGLSPQEAQELVEALRLQPDGTKRTAEAAHARTSTRRVYVRQLNDAIKIAVLRFESASSGSSGFVSPRGKLQVEAPAGTTVDAVKALIHQTFGVTLGTAEPARDPYDHLMFDTNGLVFSRELDSISAPAVLEALCTLDVLTPVAGRTATFAGQLEDGTAFVLANNAILAPPDSVDEVEAFIRKNRIPAP